jgi:uncharacterized protein YciI
MPYLIRTYDKAGSAALRASVRPAHLQYLLPFTAKILAAGGLLNDDGSVGEGGLIVLDTDDRTEAESLAANDPYQLAGLFERVEIVRWRKVFFDGKLNA